MWPLYKGFFFDLRWSLALSKSEIKLHPVGYGSYPLTASATWEITEGDTSNF